MIDQVRELVSQYGDQLALVANVSGGKDSSRMLGLLREHFPTIKTYSVMADTGFEHIAPIPAIHWTTHISARFGLPLNVVRNPNKTYLQMIERRGKFPSPQFRQCTSDLKRGPVQTFIRHLPEKVIINCTGIRAEESRNRAKQNPWKFDAALSKAGRTVINWMPIFGESLKDVLRWHWESGTPLHPVYVPVYHALPISFASLNDTQRFAIDDYLDDVEPEWASERSQWSVREISLYELENAARRPLLLELLDITMAGESRTEGPIVLDDDLSVVDGMHRIAAAYAGGGRNAKLKAFVRLSGYLRRFSCRVCIFATEADIGAIYEHDREAFDQVSALEQRIGFTMRADQSLLQIIEAAPSMDTRQYRIEYPCTT